MPTILPPGIPVTIAPSRTQLTHYEYALMLQYLEDYPDKNAVAYYGVRVGPEPKMPDDWPEALKRMARITRMRRIDAIIETPGGVEIVEVTPAADVHKVAQLEAYKMLYEQDPKLGPVKKMTILTNFAYAETIQLAAQHGITIHLYE